MKRFLICLIWLGLLASASAKNWSESTRPVIRIGVVAFDQLGIEKMRWQPTVDYLNQRLPQYQFRLVSGDVSTINQLVASGTLDFVISNGLKFLDYQRQYGAVRLLSLKPVQGTTDQAVGASIISRIDSPKITQWQELRHKHIVATSPEAFGGFQIMQGQWLKAGLDPRDAFLHLTFVGMPQEDLLHYLEDGRADVVILPTCILEKVLAKNQFSPHQFRVEMVQTQSVLPCLSSTPLYPSLSLVKLEHVNDAFARDLTKVLFEIPANSEAAQAGRYHHWTVPVKDTSVIALQDLLDAADAQPLIIQVWLQYRGWFLLALGGGLLLIGYHQRVKYLVQLRTKQLKESNDQLNLAIIENKRVAERLSQQQNQLFSAQRVLLSGELAAGMAHELNQPLMALNNYLSGCRLRLATKPLQLEDIDEGLTLALAQVAQAKGIITQLLDFTRKNDAIDHPVSLEALIHQTLPLFQKQFFQQNTELELHLLPEVQVCVDSTLLQQVLVNLLCNASEAIEHNPDCKFGCITLSQHIEDNQVVVRVRDNGIGLTEKQIAHLFVPFQTSKKDGLGLGLIICKRIVESYQGAIWAQRTSEGTIISFSLPIYQSYVDREHNNEKCLSRG